MMKGVLTDIERFALKDGPGIRTVVFFKGCNMACAWCHNPETLSVHPQLLAYPRLCVGCGACVASCADGAREMPESGVNERIPRLDRAKCTGCGACAENCFTGALVLSGRVMTVEDVLEEVLQDEAYYQGSGGGVTLSGGEATAQPAFALELLRALKERGISTALETNLYAPWDVYETLLPYVDLMLFDIKALDGALHKRWTGADNARILENAGRVARWGVPYLVRTPVIPGVNDNERGIADIAAFVGKLGGALYYELLLFNPLGESKYEALQAYNAFAGARPGGVKAALLKRAAAGADVPVRIG